MEVNGCQIEYGYSSGIYTKHVSRSTPVTSAPTQDEIDSLGGGKTMITFLVRNICRSPMRSAKIRT